MNYNNRLYPFPVLGIEDDVNGSLNVELKISSDGNTIQISPSFNLSNQTLESLVKGDKAHYVAHIYCRSTMFREAYSTTKSLPTSFAVPASKLLGETEIDFFICSSSDFTYSSKEFNPDYKGYSFEIGRGDILAYAGKGKFYANKTYEDLTSVSALMNIDNSQKSNAAMYNEYDGDKITIMLCKEDYEKYQLVKDKEYWINILLSSVVFPALLEALYFMEEDVATPYQRKRWFEVLDEIKQNSKEKNNMRIAQNILDLPNNRALDSLLKITDHL